MRKIVIIGTGYVGLVSAAGISEFGHNVICVDINKKKIDLLNTGNIPIYERGLKSIIERNRVAGRLQFSSDVTRAIEVSDIIFIAVGTPQGKNNEVDLRAVESVAHSIGKHLNGYKIICTKSTVPVGTGKKIESIIQTKNNSAEFDYVSNPEFLREGTAIKDFLHPNRVVIGARSDKAINIMRDIYRPLYINETPILVTNIETAEMIKYASNAFLALKISYINEIANLCEVVGADIHEVAKAMGQDGRISSKFLHPGPGFGGSCFPKDTQALATIGQINNTPLNTIEAAIKTNKRQKLRMVNKLDRLMNYEMKGKTIAVLGLAFKQHTDDVRDAASKVIVPELIKKGATIHAYDPIAMDNFKIYHSEINYFDNWQEAVNGADALIILTEWNEFRGMDLERLKTLLKTPIVLDTKNILSMQQLELLGFTFDNIGRKIS